MCFYECKTSSVTAIAELFFQEIFSPKYLNYSKFPLIDQKNQKPLITVSVGKTCTFEKEQRKPLALSFCD